jgi:GDP-L-fucose synthase
MNVLVTGATGFLGRHLCPALEAEGHRVIRLGSRDTDLRQAGGLDRFRAPPLDRIYHLAAWTQAGDFCLTHTGEQWIINQQINTQVLAWWREAQPQAKLIAIGSSCCYPVDRPLREENFLVGEPIDSLFTYAMTKRMLYAGLIALQRQFNMRYLCVVPSTLYGPDYPMDGRQPHFIYDLLRKIVAARDTGEPPVLWGDGQQRRELIHVSDFVRAMLDLSGRVDNELVNIGGGAEYPIRWFAETLCERVGFDPARIQYDATRYVGARSKTLDIGKLKRLLPGFQVKPLKDGLAELVEWYLRAGSNR